LIFKGATKSIGLTNVKVNILLDNALQYFSRDCKNTSTFLLKKFIQCGDGDGAGIPEPVGDEDEIQFLISVGYGRVTGKYMRIGYGGGNVKLVPTPPHCHAYALGAPLSALGACECHLVLKRVVSSPFWMFASM